MTFCKIANVVQNKRFSFTELQWRECCACETRADCSGSANNELNVVSRVGLTCAFNFRYQCHISHSPHSMSLQHTNMRKSHNWIIEWEMWYVITVRAAVESQVLFTVYTIFVGRSCSTPTYHSHEPPLEIRWKVMDFIENLNNVYWVWNSQFYPSVLTQVLSTINDSF